jgi:hypothetical protein
VSARSRHVHLSTKIGFAPLADLAPDLAILPTSEDDLTEVPMGLVMVDRDDEETHIYPLTPAVRDELIAKMQGGPELIVPPGI